MIYQKATIINGRLVIQESKEVDQSKLTSDCWLIQLEGLKACDRCQYLNKRDCGGKAIRKSLIVKENQ